jgi:putative membrane protein
MAIWMVVSWVGVVLVVIWAVRALSGGGPGRAAIRILEERFARGEIDRDEFEQRRSALEGR